MFTRYLHHLSAVFDYWWPWALSFWLAHQSLPPSGTFIPFHISMPFLFVSQEPMRDGQTVRWTVKTCGAAYYNDCIRVRLHMHCMQLLLLLCCSVHRSTFDGRLDRWIQGPWAVHCSLWPVCMLGGTAHGYDPVHVDTSRLACHLQ